MVGTGLCKRFPPHIEGGRAHSFKYDDDTVGIRPIEGYSRVSDNDWCWEFKDKDYF